MRNARKEFEKHIEGKEVKCAIIHKDSPFCFSEEDEQSAILLPLRYTKAEYEMFINQLNFNYDSGYGGQELYGIIWYTDGSWSSRGEYDGSERWKHNKIPEIPEELRGK